MSVVKLLFDSKRETISIWVEGQLYDPIAHNVGHWRATESIFIDMQGDYLGEILDENRLVRNRSSPWIRENFGRHGNCGNIGRLGSLGRVAIMTLPFGFEDVDVRSN